MMDIIEAYKDGAKVDLQSLVNAMLAKRESIQVELPDLEHQLAQIIEDELSNTGVLFMDEDEFLNPITIRRPL